MMQYLVFGFHRSPSHDQRFNPVALDLRNAFKSNHDPFSGTSCMMGGTWSPGSREVQVTQTSEKLLGSRCTSDGSNHGIVLKKGAGLLR